MNWVSIGKFAVGTFATISVGQVVDNIVAVTTPLNAKMSNKLLAKAGGYILSGMIGSMASDYVIEGLDSLFVPPKEEKKKEDTSE